PRSAGPGCRGPACSDSSAPPAACEWRRTPRSACRFLRPSCSTRVAISVSLDGGCPQHGTLCGCLPSVPVGFTTGVSMDGSLSAPKPVDQGLQFVPKSDQVQPQA